MRNEEKSLLISVHDSLASYVNIFSPFYHSLYIFSIFFQFNSVRIAHCEFLCKYIDIFQFNTFWHNFSLLFFHAIYSSSSSLCSCYVMPQAFVFVAFLLIHTVCVWWRSETPNKLNWLSNDSFHFTSDEKKFLQIFFSHLLTAILSTHLTCRNSCRLMSYTGVLLERKMFLRMWSNFKHIKHKFHSKVAREFFQFSHFIFLRAKIHQKCVPLSDQIFRVYYNDIIIFFKHIHWKSFIK